MPFVPEPNYERDVARLINYYKGAFKKVARELRGIENGIEAAQAASLLNQIAFILRELDQDTRQWCEETMTQAFNDGRAAAILGIGEASTLAEAAALAPFSLLARDTVEALINDTYSDLLMATQNTDRKIKQLVRSVVGDTLRVKALESLGRRTTKKEIVERLAQGGLSRRLEAKAWVGIVDQAGRRWNLSTYAEMVVRTKTQQAFIEGNRVEMLERGLDLAVISSHGAKDACRQYEGMIISLNGLTSGYKTYADLRTSGSIFHPNCKHTVHAVRSEEVLPAAVREKHERQMANLKR